MLLSIIVVNYNTSDLTIEALHSIFREHQHFPFEIIVFDNASNDGSADAITKIFGEDVQLITSQINLGFAEGNNRAIQFSKGDYILLLNPDTIVLNHAIDELLNFAIDNPSAGIWGGRTLFGDRKINPSSFWHKQTLWSLLCQALGLSSIFRKSRLFNPERMGGRDFSGSKEVDIVSGCFLMIKRTLWNQLEGFHPDFFMYGEEADLCLRAKKIAYQPMVTSTANIIHYGGASETIRTDKLVRLIKAKTLLIRRHFSTCFITLGLCLLSCWPLSRYLAFSLMSIVWKKTFIQSKLIWREVWERRNEWLTLHH
jgi:GT2 family glycosyltransferase